MKMRSILKSNQDLKKNGYTILRKLHKIETREGADHAYEVAINNSYFFVLSCRNLVDIIRIEYPFANSFVHSCESFLEYLTDISAKKNRINRRKLSRFLHSYTLFFNKIIAEKHAFIYNQTIIDVWNTGCLMAYIAAWGTNQDTSNN